MALYIELISFVSTRPSLHCIVWWGAKLSRRDNLGPLVAHY